MADEDVARQLRLEEGRRADQNGVDAVAAARRVAAIVAFVDSRPVPAISGRLRGTSSRVTAIDAIRFIVIELRRLAVGSEHDEAGQRRAHPARHVAAQPALVNRVVRQEWRDDRREDPENASPRRSR